MKVFHLKAVIGALHHILSTVSHFQVIYLRGTLFSFEGQPLGQFFVHRGTGEGMFMTKPLI